MTAAGEDPHGPHDSHDSHGADDCPADTIVRAAAQSAEELPLGAMALVVLVAVCLAAGRARAPHESRRRRSARTGRVVLVRTSRWRI
ncbi:hypothetical protein ACICHK_08095 [Streptomyces sp. AHU1]|uniref:hypothetical protein n=1 Tax=Streptomyces sp. AHU1 TaxID=3377215 RepID=UPI003877C2C0